MLFSLPNAFAGQGDLTFLQLIDTNANGKIDRIIVSIDNPGGKTGVVNSMAGWSVSDGGQPVDITSVILDSSAADPQEFYVDLDENDLDVDTANADLEVIYVQQGVGNGTETESGVQNIDAIATGDSGVEEEFDFAKPIPQFATAYDENRDGMLDLITIVWSEPLASISDSNLEADWSILSAFGSFANLAEVSVACGAASGAANECDYHFLTSTVLTSQGDLNLNYSAGNATVQDLGIMAADSVFFNFATTPALDDGGLPVIKNFKYQDADGNGKIDQVLVTFSETVTAASFLGASDLSFDDVGDFTGAAFGAGIDVITANGLTATVVLEIEATVQDTFDDSGSLAIITQGIFSLEDLSGNINDVPGAQSVATYSDGAAPIIKDFRYQDNDLDGKIDRFLVTFSETVIASSAMGASDLKFDDLGDFVGADFGAGADVITSSVSTVTVAFETESTAQDTHEDSLDLAISSQGAFSLRDAIGNINSTLAPQIQATISDGASPVIADFTYLDNNGDGKIDRFGLTFSEIVSSASVLRPADLSFTNVGSFTGAAFGSNTTDSININTTTATIVLGTQATTQETNEESGSIAINGQGSFSLMDLADNANAFGDTPLAQSQASFTDGAAPVATSATFYDEDLNGKLDKITLAWSEDLSLSNNPNDWSITSAANFSGLALNSVQCNDEEAGANECDINFASNTYKTDVGDLTLTYTAGTSIKDSSDNAAGTVALSGGSELSLEDGAAPVPVSARVLDGNGDGKLDLITSVWSETLSAANNAASAANWVISSAGSQFGTLTEGAVECNNGGAAETECDYNFTATTVKTDVDDLNLAYTAGTSVKDLSNNVAESVNFGSAPDFLLEDDAAPVFMSAMANSDTNINISMSEAVSTVTFGSASAWTAIELTATAAVLTPPEPTINLTVESLGNTAYTATNFAFSTAAGGVIRDASNNSAVSFSGKTIEDGQGPTITPANLNIFDSTCTGAAGACIVGDLIKFTWSNSLDDNTDVAIITADLSGFGGSAVQTLYDDQTHGDTQIGDDIYTFVYTTVEGDDDSLNQTFTVTATDIEGNSVSSGSTDTTVIDNILPVIIESGGLAISNDANDNDKAEIGDQVTYTNAVLDDPVDGSTFSIDLSTLTGDAAATSAGSPYAVIPGVLNASLAFTETITDNAGNSVNNLVPAIQVDNVSGSGFNSVLLTLVTTTVNSQTGVTLAFNPTIDLPADGKIIVVFPSQFTMSGVSSVSDLIGLTGTFGISVAGQTVTLSRNSDGSNLTAGTDASLRINSVINPVHVGPTETFSLSTKTSSGITLSQADAIPGVTIQSTAPANSGGNNTNNVSAGGGGGGGGGTVIKKKPELKPSAPPPTLEVPEVDVLPEPPKADPPKFLDIAGHWAKPFIEKITALGIVQGKSKTLYAPDDAISKAEILKIAVNAFGHSVQETVSAKPLPDVEVDSWYAPFVESALQNKIIYGFEQGLDPNSLATRGMAVTILVRAAGFTDVQENFYKNYTSHTGWRYAHFIDVPFTDYYAPYVAYLRDKGVLSGYLDGTFGGGNPITRAEIAKMVVKILDVI